MKHWIGAFITGFFIYLGLSLVLTPLIGDRAAAGIGFVAGIAAMILQARSGRLDKDA